jgi:transcription initiation factor IIF auxiliary subunit
VPTYDGRIKELGDIYFDSDNSQFTYPVSNKTWTESLADLKTAKIKEAKQLANDKLSDTDWYVTRKSEKGTAIPSDIQTERDAIRTDCNNHETAINAKTTKAQVVSYDINY